MVGNPLASLSVCFALNFDSGNRMLNCVRTRYVVGQGFAAWGEIAREQHFGFERFETRH
jgi:hypothetical protein